ncbi:hypothetical protein RchiOBHm_Chr3g0491561 [Rosa chinensis]|uniref:Uncharacterized protein n=1 Tax=Rosa chinensis TaxID=74649 RepID=A0A2P6RG93_ROSCH|nr:uncharacterized protein LOC121052237 [Rosa chinensis]PRQ45453.1 hypothetical protein RchiOBHm_Chr3g0491561 [Rosa chinensis]
MEVQTDDQLPAQQPVEKCSIRQVSRVEETGGQREIIREEEEVQAIDEQPSPPPAEQCSIGHAWSEEEVGALNKGLGSEVDVQIIEVKQSQSSVAAGSRRSIQALGFLESYLGEHQQSLASTNEASIPNLYEVAQAKAKIQRISALSIDEVMESECVQSFKSSLEFLLKSDDTAGAQSANIEHVLGKLALFEFKYSTASKITDEVNEVSKRKLELEQEVKYYTICSSI